jgi:DNA recombination protein RmuC
VIQDVQKQLGELGKATENIRELGMNVGKLEEMLRAPKLRGGLGELMLEELLRQVLPANAFAMQHRFRSGEKVDAVIHTSGGMVPVDSKFPLENFRKLVDAKTDQEQNAAARLFRQDVKKHIDDISKKYILPDEGTFDFALMYIPAENIYYETIIKDERFDEEDGLYAYATQRRVVPVSPNSFYAHLRVIALGFKGLQVEANAREIIKTLDRLGYEIQKFRGLFETLGTHLTNAKNNFDKAEKSLSGFEEKLVAAQHLKDSSDAPPPPVLKPDA